MTDFNKIIEALVACETEKLIDLVNDALAEDTPAGDILNKGLIAGMDIVGEKMGSGELFIPEVLMAARTMGQCISILKPHLGEEGKNPDTGQVIIGTVKGDLHDIGKNLVSLMLESAGMTVHDMGVDISAADFVSQIKEKQPQIVCMSALLTTTAPMMKQTVDAIVEEGIRDQVKIMVGGAPITQAFADEIGVDGYAADAGSAARLAKTLIN